MEAIENFEDIIELSKDLNVLYVEDNSSILEKTAEFMRSIFKKVDLACNGEEAMEAYRSNTYDLVITDIKMPKKDGRDLITFIKARNLMQPIIVTSAYSDSSRLMELIDLGIDSFLLKPFSTKVFFKTIYTQAVKINMRKLESQLLINQVDQVFLFRQDDNP